MLVAVVHRPASGEEGPGETAATAAAVLAVRRVGSGGQVGDAAHASRVTADACSGAE